MILAKGDGHMSTRRTNLHSLRPLIIALLLVLGAVSLIPLLTLRTRAAAVASSVPSFDTEHQFFQPGAETWSVAVEDVTGDGTPEIVSVENGGQGYYTTLSKDGDQFLKTSQKFGGPSS